MAETSYFQRLRAASDARGSMVCVGLDPDPARIPGGVDGALRRCLDVVKATSDAVCCYKPNSAFWEQYGPGGWAALAELRAAIPTDIPVLLDAKRADVGSTMRAYAAAAFDAMAMDALTVHAYHGSDSLAEVTSNADRGVYVVCRSSNPSGAELQQLDCPDRPLYMRVAELARACNVSGNVGLVVGATAPEEAARIREAFPEMPFLVPGVGAQGGDLQAAVRACYTGDPVSCLVNASRSVLYAADPGRAAAELRDAIRRAARR